MKSISELIAIDYHSILIDIAGMVLRRTPNSRWRNKISTFGMIVLAGTIHRFKSIFEKYLNLNKIKNLAEKDSPFLPESMKALY